MHCYRTILGTYLNEFETFYENSKITGYCLFGDLIEFFQRKGFSIFLGKSQSRRYIFLRDNNTQATRYFAVQYKNGSKTLHINEEENNIIQDPNTQLQSEKVSHLFVGNDDEELAVDTASHIQKKD